MPIVNIQRQLIMKVGKYNNNGEMLLVECERGIEIGGNRTTEQLYADGFKDVCEIAKPSETATMTWQEFDTCFIQVWEDEPEQIGEN